MNISLCNAIIITNVAHRKEPFMIPLDLSHLIHLVVGQGADEACKVAGQTLCHLH